jgi:hypothetical protein
LPELARRVRLRRRQADLHLAGALIAAAGRGELRVADQFSPEFFRFSAELPPPAR